MTAWQLGIAAVVYVWVAFDYACLGQMGMALAFVAYAAANLGFILAAWGH